MFGESSVRRSGYKQGFDFDLTNFLDSKTDVREQLHCQAPQKNRTCFGNALLLPMSFVPNLKQFLSAYPLKAATCRRLFTVRAWV